MNIIETEFLSKTAEERDQKKREVFNRFFLWALGIRVILLENDNNWSDLMDKASDEDLDILISFLTHKDYVDGSVALASTYDEVQQKIVVQGEGFNTKLGKVRNIIAKIFAPTILLSKSSRPKKLQEEMAIILSNLDINTAITLFPTGTRDLVAPILAGIDFMITDDMVIPLGVMLSDTPPVFASKQTFSDNFKSLIGRLFTDRREAREFVLKMNGLNNDDYERMTEGKEKGKRRRENITAKFEMLRAYGVLKMVALIKEQYPDEELHPLLQNEDNLPLIKQSYSLLSEGNNHLEWLYNNTTNSSGDNKTFLDREEISDLLSFVDDNKIIVS
jgi:hypothetical protein